jgi:hypothetical protein
MSSLFLYCDSFWFYVLSNHFLRYHSVPLNFIALLNFQVNPITFLWFDLIWFDLILFCFVWFHFRFLVLVILQIMSFIFNILSFRYQLRHKIAKQDCQWLSSLVSSFIYNGFTNEYHSNCWCEYNHIQKDNIWRSRYPFCFSVNY